MATRRRQAPFGNRGRTLSRRDSRVPLDAQRRAAPRHGAATARRRRQSLRESSRPRAGPADRVRRGDPGGSHCQRCQNSQALHESRRTKPRGARGFGGRVPARSPRGRLPPCCGHAARSGSPTRQGIPRIIRASRRDINAGSRSRRCERGRVGKTTSTPGTTPTRRKGQHADLGRRRESEHFQRLRAQRLLERPDAIELATC